MAYKKNISDGGSGRRTYGNDRRTGSDRREGSPVGRR